MQFRLSLSPSARKEYFGLHARRGQVPPLPRPQLAALKLPRRGLAGLNTSIRNNVNASRSRRFSQFEAKRGERYKTEHSESKKRASLSEQKSANPWGLSEESLLKYGNRCPQGYRKKGVLGRGGFAMVWLCQDERTGNDVAIKQIINSHYKCSQKQIEFGFTFFNNGIPRQKYMKHRGLKRLLRLEEHIQGDNETWIIYEVCGVSLGSSLYQLKAERGQIQRQKIFRISPKKFFLRARENITELLKVFRGMAEAIEVISEAGIVHCDVKTENILIEYTNSQKEMLVKQVKLIDYGSSFRSTRLQEFSMATPEYMSPQLLNYILGENKMSHDRDMLELLDQYEGRPWAIDVWSMGCVMLQIFSGLPLWMSLKTIVKNFSKGGIEELRCGLFAVKDRSFSMIISKQLKVVTNLSFYLSNCNYSGLEMPLWLTGLLKSMFSIQPKDRPSPTKIIQCFSKHGVQL